MNDHQTDTAWHCLEAAEDNTLSFPQIVGALIEAGCAGYIVSFAGRRALYVGHGAETIVELFPGS